MRLAILSSHPVQYYAPLFRELAERLDVHVFFAHKATPQNQADAGFGMPFEWDVDLTSGYAHSFLVNVSRRPGTTHFSGCDTPEIGRALRAGRFDAFLVMGWNLKSFVQGTIAARRIGLPALVRGDSHLMTHRSALKSLGKALLYPAFLRLFDAALYVGERSRAYYERYGYPESRLFFSPHCVDNAWFAARATAESRRRLRAEKAIAPDARILLFAGKLVSFKRPCDVVAAAQRCRAEGTNVEVMVAGDGPLRPQFIAAAEDADVPIHFLGFRNQSEMPAVYAAADILVLPSNGDETWGLVANEALACGRPIILSDAVGAGPDLVGRADTGRIFPVGDIAALGAAIRDVLASPPPAEAMAAKIRAYSPAAAAAGVEAALDALRGGAP